VETHVINDRYITDSIYMFRKQVEHIHDNKITTKPDNYKLYSALTVARIKSNNKMLLISKVCKFDTFNRTFKTILGISDSDLQ